MEKDYKDLYEATFQQLRASALKNTELSEDIRTLKDRIEKREKELFHLSNSKRIAEVELKRYKEENVTAEKFSKMKFEYDSLKDKLSEVADITNGYYKED